MNNSQIEASKSFTHGFVLNEQELRRIVETVEDQFKKIDANKNVNHHIKVKFINGATGDLNHLDDLFEIENIGSSQIIRIEIVSLLEGLEESHSTRIQFINADKDNYRGYTSISYKINNPSRDWAFVTSSLLEERINKIKRWAANSIGESGGRRNPFRRMIALLLFMILPFFILVLPDLIEEKEDSTLLKINEFQQGLENGDTLNLASVYLSVEKSKIEKEEKKLKDLKPRGLKGVAIILGIVALLFLSGWFLIKYYPVYNFCWGDYIEVFERKESFRKTVFIVIIAGLIISTIGGILANLTGFGK